MKLASALVVAAMLGVACHRDEPTATAPAPAAPIVAPELPADLSIELERTRCLGSCPTYTVKIDASGLITWDGRTYVDSKGAQSARIPIDSVRELLARFDAIDFKSMHDGYDVMVTDLEWAILTLRRGGSSKSVSVRGSQFVDQMDTMIVIKRSDGDGEFVPWREEEPYQPAYDANGVIVRTDADASDSPQHAAAAKAFHALDELAAAIDKAANTAQWIGDAPRKRHR